MQPDACVCAMQGGRGGASKRLRREGAVRRKVVEGMVHYGAARCGWPTSPVPRGVGNLWQYVGVNVKDWARQQAFIP